MAAAVLLSSLWWGPDLWQNVQAVYWQRQCMAYRAPADQVVYEEDLTTGRVINSRGVICWDRLYPFIRYAWAPKAAKPVLFIHERRHGSDAPQLVVIEYVRWSRAGDLEFDHWTPDPGDLAHLPVIGAGSFRGYFPEMAGRKHLRFFAGQPDPADTSHFTIPYEVDGSKGVLDGRLKADGRLELRLLGEGSPRS